MKTDNKYPVFLTIGLIVATLWSAHPLQAATNVKISGVMPPFGDVYSFQISPNGRYAVYLADQDTDGVMELYSVLLGGGAPVPLNPLLPTGRTVTSFKISPDSSRVVYLANQDTATVFELYSVPLGGPAAAGIKLNKALVTGGNVVFFQISPDSSRVVYKANQDTATVSELYSVPLGGPAAAGIKLNKALVTGGNVVNFKISPDSNRVVYLANQDTATVFELYSVPLGGPAAAGVKLNGALVAGGNVINYLISPDSSRVVYNGDQETATVIELYSVPLGGPAAAGVKLNGALMAGGNVLDFRISPDSSRVVYRAPQETATVSELYSVPLGGPAAAGIKLNKALVTGGNVANYAISPDSSRVVYSAYQQTATVLELYSVPLGGPAAAGVKLNGALVAGGNVTGLQISPDSSRVVYLANQDTATVFELYSVPLGGPASAGVKLNGALVAGGIIDNSIISPDSSRVVYLANQDTAAVFTLYSVPLGGPAAAGIKLNGTLVAGGNVLGDFQISPDSGRVIYRADQETDEVFELFMTSSYLLHLPLILKQANGV